LIVMKKRSISNEIIDLSAHFKTLLITGMRQVGKTTLLRDLCGDSRTYVTLDNMADLQLAKTDPVLFFQTYRPPVLVDEIQYAPELFREVKRIVDNSQEKGLVWMTGSQQFDMMRNVSESLAGRVAIVNLMGFSMHETDECPQLSKPFVPDISPRDYAEARGIDETFRRIWMGGFPEAVVNGERYWEMFYSSYVKTYIDRDVRDQLKVVDQLSFYQFMKTIASRTGQELNLTDVARECGISPNTAKAWVSVLVASGIVYILHPYSNNIAKRVSKHPKIYFLDTGLCAYLTGWTSANTLCNGAMRGAIFETFVLCEILKSYANSARECHIYYYRDSDGAEIDFVLSVDSALHPVEVKVSSQPNLSMTRHFKVLEQYGQPIGTGAVVCLTDRPRPLSEDIVALSVWNI